MKGRFLIALILTFMAGGVFIPPALSGGVPEVTKDELSSLLGNPDLLILDVRRNSHWTSSDSKIKGAVREKPDEIQSWADKYPKDKIIVLYCA